MTTNIHRDTAKIYAFTAKARSNSSAVRNDPASVTRLATRLQPRVYSGDAWYHDDAMAEERREHKN